MMSVASMRRERKLFKPVFVRKSERDTIEERDKMLAEIDAEGGQDGGVEGGEEGGDSKVGGARGEARRGARRRRWTRWNRATWTRMTNWTRRRNLRSGRCASSSV